jgi:4,5-dihydroxyphthalate decarboxylase
MHTVVIRQRVLEHHPWVARNLYDAFCAAKAWAMDRMADTVALSCTLPWLIDELEQSRALMGHDFWPYGLERNRETLEALVRYSHSQGLAARLMPIEELFAASTLDEYRI